MVELNITKHQMGDITIFDTNGDVIFERGNIVLRGVIRRLLSEDRKKVLLDFSGAGFVDSSNIGEFVSVFSVDN